MLAFVLLVFGISWIVIIQHFNIVFYLVCITLKKHLYSFSAHYQEWNEFWSQCKKESNFSFQNY